MEDDGYFYTNENDINPDLNCCICDTPFTDPYSTPCAHIFCRKCITDWLHRKQVCPMCQKTPVRTAGLRKHVKMSKTVNRLLVTCNKCHQSNIQRDQFSNHKKADCSELLLYCSNNKQNGSSTNMHRNVPIMAPAGAEWSQFITEMRQMKEELEHQKTKIQKQNDEINGFKEASQSEKNQITGRLKNIEDRCVTQQLRIEDIEQINIQYERKIRDLEPIVRNQAEKIESLQKLVNQFKRDSVENEDQICSLWEKVNLLTSYENPQLENEITEQYRTCSEINLSGKNLNDHDMNIVVRNTIVNRRCTSLNLSKNNINSKGSKIIADSLHLSDRLEKLNLSCNHLNDECVKFLSEVLTNNETLIELKLGSNQITNLGVRYLAEMLENNEKLEALYLFDSKIDDNGTKLLANTLSRHNQTLVTLCLSSNRLITDKSVRFLIDLFGRCRSLRRIELIQCDLSKAAKTRLRDAADNNEISISL